MAEHIRVLWQSAYAAFAVVASPYVVQGVGGAAQFAVEANLTLRVDSSQGDVWALVKQVGFIDGVLDRITNTSGVAFVPQPGATYLAVPGTTIGNPTAQELPLLVDVSVFTAVEYAVDSLRTCNSSSAIVDQFNRYDYNSDNRLSAHETAGMLYEMGRTGAPGAVMAVAKVAVLMTPFDSNFDNHLSKVEISRIDPHRAVLLDKTRDQLVADTGWRVSGTVTAAGTGLVNVSAALITAAAVGECLVIQDALLVKICLVTEIVGFPQVAPDEARCVRKNSRDMFNNTQVEYQCAGWDICGEVPDPAFSGEVAQPNLKYDCDFGACVPDTLIHGDGLVVNPVSDFRCWDTCRLVTNMSQCPHIEQRPHYCRHGSQCFFVDTLDNSVMSDDGLATKLHNLSRMVDEYAGACDVDYGGIGYREECRWMRCHAMGNALGQACDNKVVPPCRSVCEAYLQTGALGNIPGVLQNCTDPTPDSIQLSNSIVWTLNHCDALKRLNCSVFPADDPHLAAGQCQVPTRYLGGIPCVRDGECISNDCPPHEDAPNIKARGICCNADLNSCSGHGVCVSRTGLFSPNSLGPDIAVPVGGCICEVNWTGPDCSQWVMPLEMFFVLSGVSFVVTLGTAFHVKRWLRWWNWVHAAPDPTPPPSPLPPPQKPPHDSSSDDGDADVLDIAEHILDAHEQGEAEKRVDDVLVAAQDALVAPNVPGNDIQETRHAEQVA